jgi:hypothetical protein
MFYLCLRSARLDPATPRLVFSWFLYSHNVCVMVGAAGYVLFLLELLGLQAVVAMVVGKSTSALLLWYGLYFGILGRDTAEVAFSGLVRTPVRGCHALQLRVLTWCMVVSRTVWCCMACLPARTVHMTQAGTTAQPHAWRKLARTRPARAGKSERQSSTHVTTRSRVRRPTRWRSGVSCPSTRTSAPSATRT